MFDAIEYSSIENIRSGLSYGVFSTENKWANPDEEGTLKWDFDDRSADREKLLEQMDFPLVSIAMSKDVVKSGCVPRTNVEAWSEIVDGHRDISDGLKAGDKRPESVWAPTNRGNVVRRSGTHTRGDHAGKGLSKALAHYVMHKIREHDNGYRAILIHTGSEAVDKVWLRPPVPFKSEEISTFSTAGYQKRNSHTGALYNPFGSAEVVSRRIWITWPEEEEEEGNEAKVLESRRMRAVVIADDDSE
ncbi:uncharacterized protein B0H64DRAFT_379303 [Chaetomium fimeti]|uniref:Uncharacterized protein n=1 Tax=Chaetomium fimeti TaxID=1854472 RepID=A0AAE0HNT8_9PEZI|nr:hypothetical protein B0H64DRAFT_379303 [Chaetomium fimeti]